MSQSVGATLTGYATINTVIPQLGDTADIVAAFRMYHFGSSTVDYSLTTDPTLIPATSIAGRLYSLQKSITDLSALSGIGYGEFTAKGDILGTTGAGNATTVQALAVGTNGQVLSANSTATLGLQWITPYSAPTLGTTVLTSNTTISTVAGLTLTNPTINAGSGVVVLPGAVTPAQTANGSVVWDNDTFLLTVGTGTVRKTMVDTDSQQTLTLKTLTSPTVTQLYLSDSVVIFEGSTADAFETTLTVTDPTADRFISLPNVDGTIITTGNLSSITTVGTVTAGSFPVANLTGTTLPSAVVTSSLTTVGTITSGTWNGSVINGQYGGTGVANTGKTITLGGNLTTSGAFATTLTATATTSVTLPVSGTLVGSADSGTVTNTMLTGSIANEKLANSTITIYGTAIALGGTSTALEDLEIKMLMGVIA